MKCVKLKKAFVINNCDQYVALDYKKIMNRLYNEYGTTFNEIRELGTQIDFAFDKDERENLWEEYNFASGFSEGLVFAIKVIEDAKLERIIKNV